MANSTTPATAPSATDTPAPPPFDMNAMNAFATMIGEAVARGMAANTRRKITFGEYDPRTQYHPSKKTAKKLSRQTFQNGAEIQEAVSFDEEIDLLNRITHSGRYFDRLVEVSVREEGGGQTSLHLSYSNKRDHWNTLAGKFTVLPSHKSKLHAMLATIVASQEEEDAEAEEIAQARQAARAKRQKS